MVPVSNDSASDTQASTKFCTHKKVSVNRQAKFWTVAAPAVLGVSHSHIPTFDHPSELLDMKTSFEFLNNSLNNCLLIFSYCRTFGTCYPSREEMDVHIYMRGASTPTVICPLIPSNSSVIHSPAAVFRCARSTDQDGTRLWACTLKPSTNNINTTAERKPKDCLDNVL